MTTANTATPLAAAIPSGAATSVTEAGYSLGAFSKSVQLMARHWGEAGRLIDSNPRGIGSEFVRAASTLLWLASKRADRTLAATKAGSLTVDNLLRETEELHALARGAECVLGVIGPNDRTRHIERARNAAELACDEANATFGVLVDMMRIDGEATWVC